MHICVNMYTNIYIYIYTYIYEYVCKNWWNRSRSRGIGGYLIYIYLYIYIYIYKYMKIYTHIYAYICIDFCWHGGLHRALGITISTKEPYISAKEPHISAKDLHTSEKEPLHFNKRGHISANERVWWLLLVRKVVSRACSHNFHKRALYFCQRASYFR